MKIQFLKMNGLGNDFVVIDKRDTPLPPELPQLAQRLCDRKFGIGADGLLLLDASERADVRMVYLNADGSRVEMCGNGASCISYFATIRGVPEKFILETDKNLHRVEVNGATKAVKLEMANPEELSLDNILDIEGSRYRYSFINTGVPHCVLFFDDIEVVKLLDWAPQFRYHKNFQPSGTNVNIVETSDPNSCQLKIRTYERGVEDETLACGTGSVASAIIAALKHELSPPIRLKTLSGQYLTVDFNFDDDGHIKDVFLQEQVAVNFSGVIEIDG